MFIGSYTQQQKVWVNATVHKFENGQEEAGIISGYYIRVGEAIASKVSLTFNLVTGETAVYVAEIDPVALALGTYMAVITATVDTVIANQVQYFDIVQGDAIYGNSVYVSL